MTLGFNCTVPNRERKSPEIRRGVMENRQKRGEMVEWWLTRGN